jgi:hypothetical protein
MSSKRYFSNKIISGIASVMVVMVVMFSCVEDIPDLGLPPNLDDAAFTIQPDEDSPNRIHFTCNSAAFLKKWDFDNGTTAQGNEVTAEFPLKGKYRIKLTVYTSGGSISSEQELSIANDDLTLLDLPVYNFLTGGVAAANGKTWVIDAGRAGHFGVGPNPSDPALGDVPNYYSAGPDEKVGTGLYNDEFTFKLNGFGFIQATAGDVYLNNKFGDDFPGAFENLGDKTAPFNPPSGLTWNISGPEGNQQLTISPGGFIGYYSGTSSYKIVSVSENELIIRSLDTKDPALAWYQRLIPKGYNPPPPPAVTTTLPVDFQGALPPFTTFGGSTFDVVTNPSPSGINTSSKVGRYGKGTEGNWAGIETILTTKVDFSVNSTFKLKVLSPVTGRALLKFEDSKNPQVFVETFADITKVNEWEDLTFPFIGAASDRFDKMAVFMDFDRNNGGVFYIDDIRQTFVPSELTLDVLTGGSTKTWILKPSVGSFGVGPTKGSEFWYPNGLNLTSQRPCLFNDEYVFSTGNIYQYKTNGDIFAESYMGITPDGCSPDTSLPQNAAAWGNGTHSFSFTPASGNTPAYITVTGTGAFLVLPKAYNGGEYTSAPPAANRSVKYEVMSYVKNGSTETLKITLDISPGQTGSAFWTFTLTNKP